MVSIKENERRKSKNDLHNAIGRSKARTNNGNKLKGVPKYTSTAHRKHLPTLSLCRYPIVDIDMKCEPGKFSQKTFIANIDNTQQTFEVINLGRTLGIS